MTNYFTLSSYSHTPSYIVPFIISSCIHLSFKSTFIFIITFMVVNFCGLRLGPRQSRSRERVPETKKCGLTESLANLLKPRSSFCAMKAKKRPESGSKALTLKDMMASSPGEGEMGVQKQSSRKIHPSGLKEELLLEGCSKISLPVTGNRENGKKKKMKKKVSFRSPEVAEVFVLEYYGSPEVHMIMGQ